MDNVKRKNVFYRLGPEVMVGQFNMSNLQFPSITWQLEVIAQSEFVHNKNS